MNGQPKALSPPYATFGAFINFMNKLRETGVPSRIDPSVFGNASGGLSYSIISTLKFLKLIGENGVPSKQFVELVNAKDNIESYYKKSGTDNRPKCHRCKTISG